MIHFVHANESHDFPLDAIANLDGANDRQVVEAVVEHARNAGVNVAGVDPRSYNLYRNETTNDLTIAPAVKYGGDYDNWRKVNLYNADLSFLETRSVPPLGVDNMQMGLLYQDKFYFWCGFNNYVEGTFSTI